MHGSGAGIRHGSPDPSPFRSHIMGGPFPSKSPVTGVGPIDGSFSWSIPNEYSGFADGSDPHHFLNELQAYSCTSTPPPNGTATVTKGDLPPYTVP